MEDGKAIKQIVRSAYLARVHGDVEGVLTFFADDVIFEFNGAGLGAPGMGEKIVGKAALRPIMTELIQNFEFHDWKEVSLMAEGESAALRWRANIKFTKTGQSREFDVVDIIRIRDGKFAELHQSTDTSQLKAMIAV